VSKYPHFDELTAPSEVDAARLWWDRANNAGDGLRAAALAAWAAWFGLSLLQHAESSSEWLQSFRASVATKDMGGLETLSLSLNEWQPAPDEQAEP